MAELQMCLRMCLLSQAHWQELQHSLWKCGELQVLAQLTHARCSREKEAQQSPCACGTRTCPLPCAAGSRNHAATQAYAYSLSSPLHPGHLPLKAGQEPWKHLLNMGINRGSKGARTTACGRMWLNSWGEQELLPHRLCKEGWRVPKRWNWEGSLYDLRQARHLRDQPSRVLVCVYLQGVISMLPITSVTKIFCSTFNILLHCCDSCAVHIPQTCSWNQKTTRDRSHVLVVSFPGLTSTVAAVFFDHYYCWGQPLTLLKCLLWVCKIHTPSCQHPSETRLA